MNVAVLQLDIAWENKTANYAKIRTMLAAADLPPNTLVVLPEMVATGFTLNLNLAEDSGATLAAIAHDCQITLLAGLVRHRRNLAVLFNAQGQEVAAYAKRQPFRPGGERVEAGTEPVIVPCGEFQLAPTICYDLRFPEVFRDCLQPGANLFAVLACWPALRVDHWQALLQARAIENQAYLIGANRCGRDPNYEYPGRSQIISPHGEVLAEAGADEDLIQAELDWSALTEYRQKFPVLADLRQ